MKTTCMRVNSNSNNRYSAHWYLACPSILLLLRDDSELIDSCTNKVGVWGRH
jgi:hypothetical protein